MAELDYIAEQLRPMAVAIDKLSHDPSNARRHGERNMETIRASLKKFGQRTPIVVQKEGMIVRAGNGRLSCAKDLGWTHIAAVVVDESDVEATAYAIADNRTAELAEWADDDLVALLDKLDDDLREAAGFDADELEELADGLLDGEDPPEVEEDEAPEPPKIAKTKPGDIWILGEHRLLCGDSTEAASFEALMDGAKANLVVTDPPYGVDYRGGPNIKLRSPIANDNGADLSSLLSSSLPLAVESCSEGSVWYVFAPAGPQFLDFASVVSAIGVWRQTLVWMKHRIGFGRTDFHYQHEAIFYGWTPGASHRPPPDRTQSSVWQFDRPSRSDDHPTMKPVALIAHAIGLSSDKGQIVLDPFLGSGTTLIAAEQLGRRCRGIELDPIYCDVIVQRWESLTGQEAKLG